MSKREPRTVQLVIAAAVAASVFAAAPVAKATVYYVSPHGWDSNRGTSPRAAWRTVGRVNRAAFRPGDTVLFRGGSVYGGTLFPRTSGYAGAPITFSSYGRRRANIRGGITLVSKDWLVLDRLRVATRRWRTAGDTHGVMSHNRGPGSTNIVVRDCAFVNVRFGLVLTNHGDRNWTVSGNVIRRTRDSGIVIFGTGQPTNVGGDHLLFEANRVIDTGLDTSIRYPKHGVYDVGTNTTFVRNVIRRWSRDRVYPGAGLSIRAHSTTIRDNWIAGGPYGIAWTGYDSVRGTTQISGNRIWGVSTAGIALTWQTGLIPTRESFVVAGNRILTRAAPGSPRPDAIFLQRTLGTVSIFGNVVGGEHRYCLWVEGLPVAGFAESHNRWNGNHGAERWNWVGVPFARLVAYQLASGQGAGDSVGP
jgi:hypothetical protein